MVKVSSKKPITKGQIGGTTRKPVYERSIQRKKPLAQQRMEEDLEREIRRIEEEERKRRS